jgi:VanZ family protein
LRRFALVIALLAAFAADYPWHGMTNHTHWAKVGWIPFVSPPVRFSDIVANILLFLPAGVFSAPRGTRPGAAALRGALIAFPIAFAGEATQLFSHGRFPSATDLVCNVAGAALGAVMIGVLGRSFPSSTGEDEK